MPIPKMRLVYMESSALASRYFGINSLIQWHWSLDYNQTEQLLNITNNNDLKKLLENEKYFSSLRDFEKSLYQTLVLG